MKVITLLNAVALSVFAIMVSMPVKAVELMTWDREPLKIDLPVGGERLVELNRNVKLGLNPPINDQNVLRVQSSGGVLYLKANEAFDTQRVLIKDAESGEIILVDLTAKEDASDEKILVVKADDQASEAEKQDDKGSESSKKSESTPKSPTPVALIRYAAQSLYAPTRAIEPIKGIQRAPMQLPEQLPNLMPSLPIVAKPVAAWQLNGWTVTAVQLSNQDPDRSFELDPRWLQGSFYSASFMHPVVDRRGSATDSTTAFIVTRKGNLSDALGVN